MKIRKYDVGDRSKLISIYDAARKNELLLAGVSSAFIPLSNAESFECLQSSHIIVAELSERVIGFVAYKGDTLGWLYVNPAHANEGIGTCLAKTAIKEMKEAGMSPIRINVLKGNTPALKLYEKLGFKKTKQVTGEIPVSEATVQVICMELK